MVVLKDFLRVFQFGMQKTTGRRIHETINEIEGYNLPNHFEVVVSDVDEFFSVSRGEYKRETLKPTWRADQYEHFIALQGNSLGYKDTLVIYYWLHCEFPDISEKLEKELHGDTIENIVARLKADHEKKKIKPSVRQHNTSQKESRDLAQKVATIIQPSSSSPLSHSAPFKSSPCVHEKNNQNTTGSRIWFTFEEFYMLFETDYLYRTELKRKLSSIISLIQYEKRTNSQVKTLLALLEEAKPIVFEKPYEIDSNHEWYKGNRDLLGNFRKGGGSSLKAAALHYLFISDPSYKIFSDIMNEALFQGTSLEAVFPRG